LLCHETQANLLARLVNFDNYIWMLRSRLCALTRTLI
jgi:hypothetical protein